MMLLEKYLAEKADLEHQLEALKSNGNAISGALQLVNRYIAEIRAEEQSLFSKVQAEKDKLFEELKAKVSDLELKAKAEVEVIEDHTKDVVSRILQD